MNLEVRLPAREIFSQAVLELLQNREDLLVLDNDRAYGTGTCHVAETQPHKFLMIGAAETNLVGVAAGLATMGMTVWIAGFEGTQIRQTLEQWCSIIGPAKLNVKLAGYCGGTSLPDDGNGCDSQDIALMRSVPNMVIVAPGDALEARQAILAVSAQDGPAYIRLAGLPVVALCAENHEFQLGQAATLRDGTDVAMICTGRQTAKAVHAATILETVGISARILHASTIQPLDNATIAEAARGVRLVVTAEEHGIRGGLGEAVAEALVPGDFPPLLRLGFPPGSGGMVIREGSPEAEELSASRMAERIHGWLRRG